MALQLNKETPFGISGNYIRIDRINGDKETVIFEVFLYVDQAARDSGKDPLMHIGTFGTSMPNTDFMPALYNHLKTLPEFSGAIDV